MFFRALILLSLHLFVACNTTSSVSKGVQTQYRQVSHLKDLPDSAQRALGVYAQDAHDRIADSEDNFTAGCTTPPDYSNRRLVLAGLANDHILVVQEIGGRAYQVQALEINHLQKPAKITKRWHLENRPASIEETLILLKKAER